MEPPQLTPRVSLILLDPLIPSKGGKRLSRVLQWNDPLELIGKFIADLAEVSYGCVDYQISEQIVVDSFPLMEDGFYYSDEEYLRCWRAQDGFHKPDRINYHRLLAAHNLFEKVQRGFIDEVWVMAAPYMGMYESRMAGPGAFWCNAPPLEGVEGAGRRFVIMALSYERSVGEMLESYGHRAESMMEQVFRAIPENSSQNLWKLFIRHEKTHPGHAEVGTIHFAPNSRHDYDWGNPAEVMSHSHAWLSFPDLSQPPRLETCTEWGNGDTRAHHLWWYHHLPHVGGQFNRVSNNWWLYIVDPNTVK